MNIVSWKYPCIQMYACCSKGWKKYNVCLTWWRTVLDYGGCSHWYSGVDSRPCGLVTVLYLNKIHTDGWMDQIEFQQNKMRVMANRMCWINEIKTMETVICDGHSEKSHLTRKTAKNLLLETSTIPQLFPCSYNFYQALLIMKQDCLS